MKLASYTKWFKRPMPAVMPRVLESVYPHGMAISRDFLTDEHSFVLSTRDATTPNRRLAFVVTNGVFNECEPGCFCTGYYFTVVDLVKPDGTPLTLFSYEYGFGMTDRGSLRCDQPTSADAAEAEQLAGCKLNVLIPTLLASCNLLKWWKRYLQKKKSKFAAVAAGGDWWDSDDEEKVHLEAGDDHTYPDGGDWPTNAMKAAPNRFIYTKELRSPVLDWLKHTDRSSLVSMVKATKGFGEKFTCDRFVVFHERYLEQMSDEEEWDEDEDEVDEDDVDEEENDEDEEEVGTSVRETLLYGTSNKNTKGPHAPTSHAPPAATLLPRPA